MPLLANVNFNATHSLSSFIWHCDTLLQNQKHISQCKTHKALILLEKILLLISIYYSQLGQECIQSTIIYLDFHSLFLKYSV